MDLVPPSEHVCYVRCNYCNIFLEVRIPCKRMMMMDPVTVKCGQCSNLSYLTATPTPPPVQTPISLDYSATNQFSSDFKKKKKNKQVRCSSPIKHEITSSDSLSTNESPIAPFVAKPPERKHRLPSAYNRFMREEIQRIKAANPNIPHRDAFSAASKNWSRYTPRMPLFTTISDTTSNVCMKE
ncbi:Drooping leaf [Heracleum sosnowskyi]|uniref:Drooping leaf n=1 Tax=Heracleum sosnowskyi TaxID=360622 RepID=A0AAD8I8B5_9APIA|nr:Drooping leaf [Heracleum sosnowskyi]